MSRPVPANVHWSVAPAPWLVDSERWYLYMLWPFWCVHAPP